MFILRTLMFVPGNQERRIEKAHSVPADALILDLEDSIPPPEKDSARKMVAASIDGLALSGREVFVRINSLSTSYAVSDIKAIVIRGLRGICLPKTESADDIHNIDVLIADAEKGANLEVGSIGLLTLIETPKGIINAYEIVSASPRVLGVGFGAEDYALEMGINRTEEGAEIYYPRMVVEAFEAAATQGQASTSLDGRMIDAPVAERAKKLLNLAESIAKKERAV